MDFVCSFLPYGSLPQPAALQVFWTKLPLFLVNVGACVVYPTHIEGSKLKKCNILRILYACENICTVYIKHGMCYIVSIK